ncbi:PD40 domain-containing protein [Desulfovibrio litoralis]|uniref:TolB protein n=1 Tax=Desulfovibrio litoralis DSM 11393 TaxID=1121455 RepID=A0A1M7RWN8_9BACT|nr:PD40 domain-containing protein [Desulfovibrio litoralis]SHN50422.1 TolB protein [Desulfovibrio litoralis DSM 11393]
MKKITTVFLCFFITLFGILNKAEANPVQIDIFGPSQFVVNIAMAEYQGSAPAAANVEKYIKENLSFLPFVKLVDPASILGGTKLDAINGPTLDYKRFQLAGADMLITAGWFKKGGERPYVELRTFEVMTGKLIFGNAYYDVEPSKAGEIADRFCSDLMKAMTGRGEFFRSTLAFAKSRDKKNKDIWAVRPTGRDLRQLSKLPGLAMSPSWSPDGRYVVFTHIDDRTHALGVWDKKTRQVQRIKFPGNTVIGPAFLPDNRVAVSLSMGRNPSIYLLSHLFKKETLLEDSHFIDVSPSFDATGKIMAYCSSRLGSPQIFVKNLGGGGSKRVSTGGYNTDPSISPDGTLVAYAKMTDAGHRIFVYDMVTNTERQVSFGPGNDEEPSFAGDSYFLAFSSTRGGVKQIYLVTRQGGDVRKVPTGSGDASFPAWGLTD